MEATRILPFIGRLFKTNLKIQFGQDNCSETYVGPRIKIKSLHRFLTPQRGIKLMNNERDTDFTGDSRHQQKYEKAVSQASKDSALPPVILESKKIFR